MNESRPESASIVCTNADTGEEIPGFTLLATDPGASFAVNMFLGLVLAADGESEQAKDAAGAVTKMERWYNANMVEDKVVEDEPPLPRKEWRFRFNPEIIAREILTLELSYPEDGPSGGYAMGLKGLDYDNWVSGAWVKENNAHVGAFVVQSHLKDSDGNEWCVMLDVIVDALFDLS